MLKGGAYKFEESSWASIGGFIESKGKGKFNDIINTKVKLKEEYMPIGWKKKCGQTLGEVGRR